MSSSAIDFSFRVTDGASAKFSKFDEALRRHMRVALASVGTEIRDAARGLAPRRSGALAGSIRAKYSERGDTFLESVKPGKRYAHFMEYGVVNHGTKANKAVGVGGSKNAKRMKVEVVRSLRSVGAFRIPPHPFMRPALHSMLSRVRSVVEGAVADAVLEVDGG
jgi:HK97 gp10 family phage protein